MAVTFFNHKKYYPRSLSCRYKRKFVRKYTSELLKVNRPFERLTPNDAEGQAQWWLSSVTFFNGNIDIPSVIPPPPEQHSRDDVPEDVYRQIAEMKSKYDEQNQQLQAQDSKIKYIYEVGQAFMSSSGPSFFDGVRFPMTQFTTPLYEQSMHLQYPVSFTLPHILLTICHKDLVIGRIPTRPMQTPHQ